MEVWADSLAAGISNNLFWASTPREIRTLRERIHAREITIEEARAEAAALNAGLVASAVYNVHRQKGSRAFKPKDFIRQKEVPRTPENMAAAMEGWAAQVRFKLVQA